MLEHMILSCRRARPGLARLARHVLRKVGLLNGPYTLQVKRRSPCYLFPVENEYTGGVVWFEVVPSRYGLYVTVHKHKPSMKWAMDCSYETAIAMAHIDYFVDANPAHEDREQIQVQLWDEHADLYNGEPVRCVLLVEDVQRWQPPHEDEVGEGEVEAQGAGEDERDGDANWECALELVYDDPAMARDVLAACDAYGGDVETVLEVEHEDRLTWGELDQALAGISRVHQAKEIIRQQVWSRREQKPAEAASSILGGLSGLWPFESEGEAYHQALLLMTKFVERWSGNLLPMEDERLADVLIWTMRKVRQDLITEW